MPKYYVNVAMSIRAYGSVAIYGATAEEARKTLTADYIADNFKPHGGGDDDLDYDHPSDISLDGSCHDADTEEDFDFEPVMIPDGDWINDPLGKAAPDMLAALQEAEDRLAEVLEDDPDASMFEAALEQVRAAIAKAEGGASSAHFETAQSLEAKYGRWQDHPDYSDRDWRDDETRLGYWEWVASKVNEAEGGAAAPNAMEDAANNGLEFWADIAAAEGWGTFECSDGWEIQRDDEAQVFGSDDEAERFVSEKATAGSIPHQKALAFVLENARAKGGAA